jgi:hypothetical protein
MTDELSDLDVFYGDLTATRTLIYARLPWPHEADGLKLAGHVRGPFCRHAATLPLSVPLVDCGPGPTLLAKAIVAEACFWSSDLPAIYEVHVQLMRGKETVAAAKRQIGLRSLGCKQQHFIFESRRWVLRGVMARSAVQRLPREWQETAACLVAQDPTEEQLAEASRDGALTVVDLSGLSQVTEAELRSIARFPAVAMAVLGSEALMDESVVSAAPNLLLAQAVSGDTASEVQPGAKVLWASADDPSALARLAAQTLLPVVAVRRLAMPVPLEQARGACDVLQRDLAPLGQFAGYVV